MQKLTRVIAILLVLLALVLAIIALTLGRRATQIAPQPSTPASLQAGGPAHAASSSVVITTAPLPAGQPIPAASLQLANAPAAPANSYRDIDAVAGGIPSIDLPGDSIVSADLLARGLALRLKPGERALAVPVDETSGSGNRILPGDHIDVFVSLKDPQISVPAGGTRHDRSQSRLLLSDLRVLAYGSKDLPAPPVPVSRQHVADGKSDSDKKPETNAEPPPPRTAVLAVPVAEIDQLLLGVQNGKLTLALRSPGDTGQPDASLFPQPSAALAPLASLTAEQRSQLTLAENQAYAGINGDGLTGSPAEAKPVPRHSAHASPELQIIRGSSNPNETTTRVHSP